MVTYSMVFKSPPGEGVSPIPNIPLVGELQDAPYLLPTDKFPKSVELPVVAIVK